MIMAGEGTRAIVVKVGVFLKQANTWSHGLVASTTVVVSFVTSPWPYSEMDSAISRELCYILI